MNIDSYTTKIFSQIAKEWMLISVGDKNKTNAMTASWGGMGVLWNKNVAFIFVRPQRFTHNLLQKHSHFALSFFDESFRSTLQYMGKATGYKEDKIAHENLQINFHHAPYFEAAKQVMICKKIYQAPLQSSNFLDQQIIEIQYKNNDYHTMYVGEIVELIQK